VTIFCTEAFIAVVVLVLRRNKSVGGELGGPKTLKYVTAAFFIGLWVFYLVMSSLEAYDVIEGF
jgi:solute carrier family 8 (sodium/calcium exchanger)